MNDNVISIVGRRTPDTPLVLCGCGSAWFSARVCLEGQHVTGYAVPITCVECGAEVSP